MPILRHLHSLIASALIFGTAVLLMLWVPAKALRYFFPGFLPYIIASHAETPVSELSLELLLLQVSLLSTVTIIFSNDSSTFRSFLHETLNFFNLYATGFTSNLYQ